MTLLQSAKSFLIGMILISGILYVFTMPEPMTEIKNQLEKLEAMKLSKEPHDTIFSDKQNKVFVIRNWEDWTVRFHNYSDIDQVVEIYSKAARHNCKDTPCIEVSVRAHDNAETQSLFCFEPWMSVKLKDQ